jgi:acyl dehydratase
MTTATWPITTLDEFEQEFRKGVGEWLSPNPPREASLDNLRRFGDGVGDYNPLWRDQDHAAASRFGAITAPPIFIYGVAMGIRASIYGAIDPARLSSKHFPMNYAGGTIDFVRPIWRGDTITAREQVLDVVRKTSARIGPFCICSQLVTYTNQRRELVATKTTLMARYHNLGDGRTMEYDREAREQALQVPPDPLVWERARRGAATRYWEDVVEGEAIPELHKGIYTVTELFLFTHCVYGTTRAPRAALEGEESTDLGGGGRYDEEHARKRRNMPGQFDWGPQRVCWMSQIATDWMGDDGTLRRMDSRVRHPNVVGDTNTVRGEVARKYQQDGEHLVDLDVRAENQTGLATAFSRVTVALPTRAPA